MINCKVNIISIEHTKKETKTQLLCNLYWGVRRRVLEGNMLT